MKTISKTTYAKAVIAIFCIAIASSCTDLTNGLSTDPVNITNGNVIQVSKYLTGVEVALIGVFEGDVARTTGMWDGYFSGEDRQYIGLGGYSTSGQDFDVSWGSVYTGIFANTKILKKNANAQKNFVSVGIAQVIEGMSIGLAADLWGDVPYTEIGKFPKITSPKYETQTSVYAAAQVLLDSAIANLALAGNGTGDFMLGGNKAAWVAVAHTVKARLYLHTKSYTNAIAQALLGVPTVGGNLMATHGDAYLQTFNIYYSFTTYDRTNYMGANSYAPKLLDPALGAASRNNAKTNEEARLNYIYYPGGGLNFGSITYEPNVLVDFDWGNPTEYNGFFGATTSFPIVTWEENQLILAESYMKQAVADPTNALVSLNTLRAYYNTGAHINSGYTTDYGYLYAPYVIGDFAPAGMENLDNVAQNTALLREILQERYVTLIGQIEGFNDMRRTGNFLNIPKAAGKADYPRRALYSQIEVNTNLNVPKTGVGLYDPVASFLTPY